MSLTKDGFYKSFSGAIGNNNYLLEAGGGHIAWGNAANQIPYSNGTVNTSLNADMTDGLHVHTGRNNEANKIVRTDGSGYIQAGWINTTSGDMGSTAFSRIYVSNDAYIRYVSVAKFKTGLFGGQVGSPSVPIYWTGSAFATCIVSFGNQNNGEHNANNINDNGIKYYNSNGPSTSLGASTSDGALYSQAYSTSWVGQIAQDYRNGGLYVRGKNNGTWQSWYRVWDNRTTYVSGGKGYIGSTEITQVNNSDTVDGYHETSFFRYRGSINVNFVDLTTYTANATNYQNPLNGIYTVSRSGYSGGFIAFTGSGSSSGLDIYFEYSRGGAFKFRRRIDSNRLSGAWETILTDVNYTSYINNYYWANVKVSTSSQTNTTPQFGYVGIGTGVNTSYRLNISGNSLLAGTTYFGSTSYWINNGGVEYMYDIRGSRIRLVDNWVGFYTSNNAGGNRLGYIQTDGSYMYFRKENGNAGFNFNGNLVPSSNNSYTIGTSSLRWANVFGVLGNYSGQVTVSIATGTAPFAITSTTKVNNLNVDLLDNYHSTMWYKEGLADPNGKSDKPWHLIAEFTQNNKSSQINTGITLFVRKFYGATSKESGILVIRCRYESGAATPSFYYASWSLNNSLPVADFIITSKRASNVVTLRLYCKLTGWNIYAFTKISEGGWGIGLDSWKLYSATYSSTYAMASIPTDETQVQSSNIDISNNAASATVASKLGTSNVGSATKGIYLDAGTPKAMTYSLNANILAGTANRMARYSGINEISSASTIYASNTQLTVGGTSAPANSGIFQAIGTSTMQHIYPQSNGAYDLGKTNLRWRTGYYSTHILIGATDYTAATSAVAGTLISAGSIEMSGSTPYIDFHNGLSTADFTTRIIEDSQGRIHIQRGTATTANLTYANRGIAPLLYVQGILYSNSNIENAGYFLNNISSAGGGYYLYGNNTQYGRLYIQTIGTANSGNGNTTRGAQGEVYLYLGNATERPAAGKAGGANNSRGRIIIYGTGTGGTTIMDGSWSGNNLTVVSGTNSTAGSTTESIIIVGNSNKKSEATASSTGRIRLYGEEANYHDIYPGAPNGNRTHYLPNATGWIATGGNGTSTGAGSATNPVFLSTAGILTATTYSLSATVNAGTANRIAWYNKANSITSAANIWTNGTKLGVNITSEPSYNLYVSGTSYFNGNVTHNGVIYLANGTTYFINNSAVGYLNDLRVDQTRLVDNWIGFYQSNNAGGNRYGYIQANADRMYFKKENGVNSYAFDFAGGHIYTNGNYIFAGYLNTAISDENPTIGSIYIRNTSDNYIRRISVANFGSQLGYRRNLGASNYITITVNGDAATYYPVVIGSPSDYYPYQFVSISRTYNETAPDSWNTSTHKGGLSMSIFWNGSRYWDGNAGGGEAFVVRLYQSYCTMVGGVDNSTAGKVVWLRGGGANYHIHSMQGIHLSATVYTSTYTDSASRSFAPRSASQIVTPTVQWPGDVQNGAAYLRDRSNSTATYSNYGASGLGWGSITWLTCWNGYELRAISKAEMANTTIVNQNTSSNADYPLVWSNRQTTTNDQGNQLYKSYNHLVYNPSTQTLKVSRIISHYANHTQTSMRHIDAGLNSVHTDHQLYIGYGAQTYTDMIRFYYSTGTTDSISSRTEFMRINSNGAYALTRFGVNGQNTGYTLHVNGTGNFENNIWVRGSGVYLRLGPQNSSHAHYETNASTSHWFNKRVDVNGAIWRYNTNYGIADDGRFYALAMYANRSSSSTDGGVSLYSNDFTYAVMFRSTGNRGKWGDVQSDWATYSTMSNTAQRGWVWQSGTAEANMSAALSVRGVFATRAVGNNAGYIAFPQNNSYYTSTSTITGALKVVLPRYKTNTMIMFDVNIFTYDEGTSNIVTYRIGGYEYGSTGWYAPVSKVFSWGRGDKVNLSVRFGYDGSKTCITIGETNTTWSYPQVSISNITYGYSDIAISSWGYGWGISFTTTLPSSVSTTFTDPYFNGMYWANQRVRPTSSTTTTPQFGKVMINTTSTTYQLNISGDSYATGWSRAGSGFYCENTGVHFTHQGSVGEIDMTSNNEFLWGASGSTLYFNYRGVSRGTTVTNYIWNAGSSSTYAGHTQGWLNLFPGSRSNWGEGIRIHSASNGWTSLILCGTDNTGDGGTSANSWSLHTYGGNFYLNKNNSNGAVATRLWGHGNGYTFGSTSRSSANVTVTNWIEVTGATSATMSYSTTNPRITFSENGTQAVGLVYSDWDSYRSSKGLKVMDVDNSDTGNVWLEVQGKTYGPGFVHTSYNSYDYLLTSNGDARHITSITPYGYVMKETLVDLSDLDGNTYYPITFGIGAHSNVRIEVRVSLNTGRTDTNWMTHSSGFSFRCIWEVNGSGWGTNPITRTIYAYNSAFTNIGNPGGEIGQLSNASVEYIYLRGHAKYYIYTSHNITPVVQSRTYTASGQSVAPKSSIDTSGRWGASWNIFPELYGSGSSLYMNVGGTLRGYNIGDLALYWANIRVQTSSRTDTSPTVSTIYAYGFHHRSYNSSTYLLRSDGGVAAFNWSGQSGQPTWVWGGNSFNTYYVYNPSNFHVSIADSLSNPGKYYWANISLQTSSSTATNPQFNSVNIGATNTGYGLFLASGKTLCLQGTESNDIYSEYHNNSHISTNSPGSYAAIRYGFMFRWYNTYWKIGNVRGSGSDTYGFGIADKGGARLGLLVRPGSKTWIYYGIHTFTSAQPWGNNPEYGDNNINGISIKSTNGGMSPYIHFIQYNISRAWRFATYYEGSGYGYENNLILYQGYNSSSYNTLAEYIFRGQNYGGQGKSYVATCEGNNYNIVCLGTIGIYRSSGSTIWLANSNLIGLVGPRIKYQPKDQYFEQNGHPAAQQQALIVEVIPRSSYIINDYTNKTTVNVCSAIGVVESTWWDGQKVIGRVEGSDKNVAYGAIEIAVLNNINIGGYNSPAEYGKYLSITARRPYGANNNDHIGLVQFDGLVETGNGSIASIRITIFGFMS